MGERSETPEKIGNKGRFSVPNETDELDHKEPSFVPFTHECSLRNQLILQGACAILAGGEFRC